MATTCTVTATLNTAAAADLQGNSFVRFRLRNFSGYVPRISGTAIVAEPVIDVLPDSSGGISTTLWGNDNIIPLNTLTSPQYNGTFYTVEFWNAGRITSSGNYIITGSSFNLDTAAQMSTPAQTATGGAGNTSPVLQVNGTNNTEQTLLNLKNTASVTWVDNGDGSVGATSAISFKNNGTNNSSQTTLNLESTDSSVTITDAGSGAINFQVPLFSLNTAGKGWFWGCQTIGDPLIGSGESLGSATNVVYCAQLVLPYAVTVRKITFTYSGGSSSNHAYIGIYSYAGNTKLVDSGAIATPFGSGLTVSVSVTPVTLPAGVYWAVNGIDTSSSVTTSGGVDTSKIAASLNKNYTRVGTAANAISGALPATLGTITAATIVIPAILFEV